MHRQILNELAHERQKAIDGIHAIRNIQRDMKQNLNDTLILVQQLRRKLEAVT